MGKVALLTGGARRIGAALAEELAGLGYDIALHYNRSHEEARALAARLAPSGVQVGLLQADLSDAAALEALTPRVYERFGRMDLLINNASMFAYDLLPGLQRESWEKHLALNFSAPVFLIRDFQRCSGDATGGLVVNMLDQKVINTNPDYFSYTGAKTALAGLTRTLALALAPRLRLCGIAPGVTLPSGPQTEDDFRRAAAATPLGYTSSLADVRRTLRFIIETPSVNGQIITIDSGESLLQRPRDVAYDV